MNTCSSLNESFFIKRGLMTYISSDLDRTQNDYSGILVCYKGNLILDIEGEITTIQKNQLIGFRPFTSIKEIEKSDDCEVTIIGIHNNLVPHFSEPFYSIEPLHLFRIKKFSKVDLTVQQLDYFNRLFDLFELKLNEQKSIFNFQKIKSIFTLISYEIIQLFLNHQNHQITELSRAKIITSNFYILLNTNINQLKGVEYFADKLNITPKHLISSVKATTQETPRKIIDRMILSEAKKMLKEECHSIQNVAEKLGFSDASSFTKFFKRNANYTPKFYQNSTEDLG